MVFWIIIKHFVNWYKPAKNKAHSSKLYKDYFEKVMDLSKVKKEVVFENVTKVYDNGIKAIDNLSLKINPGEFVVLLGPSGCGKTTLLRMIAGLESISEGYIKLNGAIINGIPSKNRNIAMVFQNYALYPFMNVEKNIAFGLKNKMYNNEVYKNFKNKIKMTKNPFYNEIQDIKANIRLMKKGDPTLIDEKLRFKRLLATSKKKQDKKQFSSLKQDLTNIQQTINSHKKDLTNINKIKEFKNKIKDLNKKNKHTIKNKNEIYKLIESKLKSAKIWKDNISNIVEDVCKMLNINLYTRRKPAELSGGQRQRVALARAISKKTGLFLYDEPLSNLDARLRAKMRIKIREIHNQLSSTSIYVTHDQVEAMSMADKIVVMNKGYIQQIGSPREVLEKPQNLFVAKFIGNTNINIFNVVYKKNLLFETLNGAQIQINKSKDIATIKKWPTKIVMAMRPEHIIVDPQIVSNFSKNKFQGKIINTELLGNDVLIIVKNAFFQNIQMIAPIYQNLQIGDTINFVINPNKIHIYDDKTGYNILTNWNKENQNAKNVWFDGIEERRKNIYIMNVQKRKMPLNQKIITFILAIFFKTKRQQLHDLKSKIEYGNQKKAS